MTDPVAAHRTRLERLAERRAVGTIIQAHEASQDGVRRVLDAVVRGHSSEHTNPPILASLRLRLYHAQMEAARFLAGELSSITRDAHADSASAAARLVSQYAKGRTPLDDPSWTARVASKRSRDATLVQRRYLDAWGAEASRRANLAIDTTLAQGGTLGEIVSSINGSLDSERWRIERIARTEASFAYNEIQADAVEELRREWPDTMKRWVEHVSDIDRKPLDNKVGPDSVAMHGQVTEHMFTMPTDNNVDSRIWGSTWEFPPNRSNDRAVIMPWRRSWGIPGWIYRNGRRVWLTR